MTSGKKFQDLADYNEKFLGIPHSKLNNNTTGESLPASTILHSVSNLRANPRTPTWTQNLPSKLELYRQTFGREDKNHSFTQTACFETTMFHVLKSGYLDIPTHTNLCNTHTLIQHMANMITKCSSYDFTWLRAYDKRWKDQTFISREKMKAFMACLFHYDMDTGLVMRYVGNNYTAAYRNVPEIISRIRPMVDPYLIEHFERVMLCGCPTKFVAESSRENAMLYWRQGNNPSINKNLEKVLHTMNKEDKNNFVIPMPSWLARFVPHLFFTPQHNLVKSGKKDRLIFNAAERPTIDAISVNMMTSTAEGTELDCKFGEVKRDLLTRIWNLRISYPTDDIILHANDVKSCFRQLKHHPNVMGAFSFIIGDILFLQCGLTFGSDFSPANWEVIRRIAEQLAEKLFHDKSLRAKHRKYLDRLQWNKKLGKPTVFYPATPDAINQGVIQQDGTAAATPHKFFVDDDCYAEVFRKVLVEQAVAASIEAIFLLLGESDLDKRQDPISFDKMEEMVVSYSNKILGQIINTRQMEVETPPEFIAETLKLLRTTWHPRRKRFTVSEAEILAGRLNYISETAPWLKFMVSHLYSSITFALTKNTANQVHTNKQFRDMIRLQKDAEATELHRTFAQAYTGRAIHHDPKLHNINSTLKEEIKLITAALSADWVNKRSKIAHMIPRSPTGVGKSDSSLSAAGGYSFDMFFWWYLEWPQEIRQFTLKYIKNNKNGDLISINALEYAALIINFVAATHYFTKIAHSTKNPHPTTLLYADNTTAESWVIKGCKSSLEGRALGRLQCALHINNPVGINVTHVSSTENEIADRISRFKNSHEANIGFPLLAQDFPQLKSCKRFLPSAELISSIMDALLLKKSSDPLQVARQLLAEPGKIIT